MDIAREGNPVLLSDAARLSLQSGKRKQIAEHNKQGLTGSYNNVQRPFFLVTYLECFFRSRIGKGLM